MTEPASDSEVDLEHLVSVVLDDGSKIVFSRTDDKEVRVCHGEHCVVLPHASGQVTMDFLTLLEPFGKIEEPSEEVEKPEEGLNA